MANIEISQLHPVGSELFQDSESFLNELNEQELGAMGGGSSELVTSAVYINTKPIANSQAISIASDAIISVSKVPPIAKSIVKY
ncbi:MAG: hypothetical protein HC903_18900 [Methylacidiphilales bacterium]|nr:hypothetical protein [Candidatus Methylacidiphilales bacterium]NJR18137.1 hypothetical protein [Calothrix sp. CSU_2_0]